MTKLFVHRTGGGSALPVGSVGTHALEQRVLEGPPLEARHGTRRCGIAVWLPGGPLSQGDGRHTRLAMQGAVAWGARWTVPGYLLKAGQLGVGHGR